MRQTAATRSCFVAVDVIFCELFVHFSFFLASYYGLWLWFPELFSRLEKHYEVYPNVTQTLCQIINENQTLTNPCQPYAPPSDQVLPSFTEFRRVQQHFFFALDRQVFINSFILAIAPLPTNIWTIFHMDKLGRKFFLGDPL